jgi:hypothetical protein
MKPSAFVEALTAIQLDDVFNPYSDRCMVLTEQMPPKDGAPIFWPLLKQQQKTASIRYG